MKKTTLTLFILILAFAEPVSAQQVNEDYKTVASTSLYNPSDFKVLNDSTLIISDNTTDFPVYLVNINTDEITGSIRAGNGPGELSNSYKNISITGNRIFIWDNGNQLLNYYDHSLNYLGSKAFSGFGKLYSVVLNDEFIYFLDSSDDFIKMYQYDPETIKGAVSKSFSISAHPFFEQFKNHSIRQAFAFTFDDQNNLIVANQYTSLVFLVSSRGIEFHTTKPLEAVLDGKQTYALPDILYNPLCTLDLDFYGGNIFVLSKGKTADESVIAEEYNYRLNEYVEDFMNAQQLLLYNNEGVFQKKISLPVPAKKVEFWGDQVFVLHTVGGVPEIRVYGVE